MRLRELDGADADKVCDVIEHLVVEIEHVRSGEGDCGVFLDYLKEYARELDRLPLYSEDRDEPEPESGVCAVCGVEGILPAGYIALAGYTFTLPECEQCAGTADRDLGEAKEDALRAYAREHPETRGGTVGPVNPEYTRAEKFVITPETM